MAEEIITEVKTLFPISEAWQEHKVRHICAALTSDPVDIEILRRQAISKDGLLCKELRKRVWPKLMGVSIYHIPPYKGPSLFSHKEKAQVILDVNRCGRRIPKDFSDVRCTELLDELTRVILRLLVAHTELCYYQGLHDITLTLLLVLGEDVTFGIMNILVQYHLRDFLDTDINYTKQIVNYLSPLLSLEDDELQNFIENSECQNFFSLSWIITWFTHVVYNEQQACRVIDFFLASHPIMPVYLSASLVLNRRDEVLAQECEMSAVHGLLSKLPENLDYDTLINEACELYDRYPPSTVASYGRIRLNDGLMNRTYYKFQRLTRQQRPDQILATLPTPPSSSNWLLFEGNMFTLLMRLLLYSTPVMIGVVVYWWIGHQQLFDFIKNTNYLL